MDLKLDGKTAAITGGSAGIGRAIALSLAKEGVNIAICARHKEPLETAAADITEQTNRKIVPIVADLTKTKDAEAFVKGSVEAFGKIDILINNAGSAAGGTIEYLSDDDWEAALALKFFGYVRCTRAIVPYMQENGGG